MKKRIWIMIIAIVAVAMLAGCVAKPAMNTAEVSAVSAAAIQSQAPITISNQLDMRNSMSVAAQGEIKLMPDVAYATVGVISNNAKLATAQTDNRTKMDAVYKALNDKGITKDNIRTASYNVNPQYDYTSGTGKITGYEVSNTIEITVGNLDTIGDLLDACQAAGANTAYPIRFDIKDKTAAYNDALKQAVEKAKAKADVAAKASGITIGGVMTLEENYSAHTPMYDNRTYAAAGEKADAAVPKTQITAGEMTITADVHIVYEIKNP